MSTEVENNPTVSNEDKPISTVSHKRRVHFPTDESQLRIISISPEPSSDQPLSSLGVILQRYRNACQRLQIRPLNCLLDQLSAIDDRRKSFQDRLDSLRIINERLDLKHIDAIEEIFSRCRFHTLDLDSSFSDESTLIQFFDVIEYYETCTHLNLSNNRSIGIPGYQALTKYLRKTRVLERLDMNSMRFDDTSMIGFGRSVRLSSTLYELHAESCQLNGKMLQKFITSLRSCVCLRELYLCDNRLQVQDSLLINELIRSCGQRLHLLDLRSNSLQDNGMSHIASQFSQYDENHKQQNSISKISFQANQITHQGIAFLAKSLLHNRTIRSLNLSHNQITNEGLYLLRDALLTNRTINELILRNCRLTDQAAIALAEYIAESSTIQYIDLRENPIQISGICGMAIAMKTNKSLFKLDFDPIISTAGYASANIDRTIQQGGLLSLTNLRRMTVGLGGGGGGGGFGSTTSSNTNETGDQNSQELLEQKMKWINDIQCICERNSLIHEAQQQEQQQQQEQSHEIIENNEKSLTNGIEQLDAPIIAPNDIYLEEQIPSENDDIDNYHEEKSDEILPSTEILVNASNEIEQSSDTSVNQDMIAKELITNENDEAEQTPTKIFEPESNGNNHEESHTNVIVPDTSPLSEDHHDDHKRRLHHSDSLYLLRRKVQNEHGNTNDDESQLSSTIESLDGVE